MKPIDVKNAVKEKTGVEISLSNHTDLWKAFSVRPKPNSVTKFETNAKYCIYDEPHKDYLYTSEWVNFIVKLISMYGFKKENIHSKCKEPLKIEDFN